VSTNTRQTSAVLQDNDNVKTERPKSYYPASELEAKSIASVFPGSIYGEDGRNYVSAQADIYIESSHGTKEISFDSTNWDTTQELRVRYNTVSELPNQLELRFNPSDPSLVPYSAGPGGIGGGLGYFTNYQWYQGVSISKDLELNQDGSADVVFSFNLESPINQPLTLTPQFRQQSEFAAFGSLPNDWANAIRILVPNAGWSASGTIDSEEKYNSNVQWIGNNVPKPSWSDLKQVWETYIAVGNGGLLLAPQEEYFAELYYYLNNESAYIVVEGPTWEEAQANAQLLGGHLVTINDALENSFVHDIVLSRNEWLWIGFTDANSEGTWSWASGEPVTFTSWQGYPNNAWGGQDYAVMYGDGNWDDVNPQPLHPDGPTFWRGLAEITLPPSYFSPLSLSYALKAESDSNLTQLAVLGDSVNHSSRFTLELSAASLRSDYLLESADITLSFDPIIFGDIQASDIRIGSALPIANAVEIDNQNGTIRIAAASLADLDPSSAGTGIASETVFASISLDFDEAYLQTIAQNQDGSLLSNPLSFELYANANDTVFSRSFTDSSGQLNRDIQTLGQLGGSIAVSGQDVTLYEAKINLEQLGDGLVLGTQRVIGSDAAFTNLLRSGDTITSSAQWLNVGNIAASNITVSGLANANAQLLHSSLTAATINSGSFVDGLFRTDGRESTTLTADIKITGAAGSIVNLADGILSIQADGSTLFSNLGKGSKNLITFQGDLNYDGRVSMKDLAYLNAGAARQQLITSPNGPATTVAAGSLARDVDANFDGRIDLADLAVLDADWGKTLHTGIEGSFLGSGSQTSHITWEQLDSQGTTTWNNTVFKDQNALEASASFIGSLESPLSTGVIGADGDLDPNNPDITGTFFQDRPPA